MIFGTKRDWMTHRDESILRQEAVKFSTPLIRWESCSPVRNGYSDNAGSQRPKYVLTLAGQSAFHAAPFIVLSIHVWNTKRAGTRRCVPYSEVRRRNGLKHENIRFFHHGDS